MNESYRRILVLGFDVLKGRYEKLRELLKFRSVVRFGDGMRMLIDVGIGKEMKKDSFSVEDLLKGKSVVRLIVMEDVKKNKLLSDGKRLVEGGKGVKVWSVMKIIELVIVMIVMIFWKIYEFFFKFF